MVGLSPNQFKGDYINAIPVVKDLLTLKYLVFDINIVDGNIFGGLAIPSSQKYGNTVRCDY